MRQTSHHSFNNVNLCVRHWEDPLGKSLHRKKVFISVGMFLFIAALRLQYQRLWAGSAGFSQEDFIFYC